MSALESHIESFLNGNVSHARAKLKRRTHRELRQAYSDFTGHGSASATAFADFIKGDCSFQEYCNAKSEAGEANQ